MYCLAISSALKKVHSHDLLHRDLKPQNVLLFEGYIAKLADFGGTKDEASITADAKQTGTFSRYWADMAARVGKYSKKSEVYAFGLLAYYFIFGVPLYSEENEQQYLENELRIERKDCPPAFLLAGIINMCLDCDPSKRPSFEDLEKSIFF